MKPWLLVAGLAMLTTACGGGEDGDASAPAPAHAALPQLGAPAAHLIEGRAVYDKWCAPCHAPAGMMPGTIALEAKYEGEIPAALIYRTDLSKEVIAYFVRNGVSLMAPFRKTEITDADLDALGDYLTAPLEQRGVDVKALEQAMTKEEPAQ